MRQIFVAIALTASLLVPAPGQPALSGQLWPLLSLAWSGAAHDAGCGFDPDGRCAGATAPARDEGCGFDPSGRCTGTTAPARDEGCGFDPDGRCAGATAPARDAGCGFDPSGGCIGF